MRAPKPSDGLGVPTPEQSGVRFLTVCLGIRCTPAMAAGVTNTLWTVRDLVEMIEA